MLKYLLAGLTIAFLLGMVFFAVYPNPSTLVPISADDKLLHFLEFFFFTLMLSITLVHYKVHNFYLPAISVIIVLGFLTEALQLYSSTRTFSLLDLGADVAGGFLALGIVRLTEQIWKSSKQ